MVGWSVGCGALGRRRGRGPFFRESDDHLDLFVVLGALERKTGFQGCRRLKTRYRLDHEAWILGVILPSSSFYSHVRDLWGGMVAMTELVQSI